MAYFARFSPFRALRDLRYFLAQRQPYELWFLLLAIVLTSALLYGLLLDSKAERPYQANITYVEQWSAARTDREIIARQKIDKVTEDRVKAAQEARRKAVQADFKKIDDRLKALGL
ncbi:MAG: hypothetical protein V4659_03570 [Pseudomonadota bacterium]